FDPQLTSASLGRGRVFKRLVLMEQAIVDFKKSIDIDPQPHPGVVIEIADMLQGSKNGGIDASLHILDEAMKRTGVLGLLQDKAVSLEASRGGYDAAIDRMRKLGIERKYNPFWRVDFAELMVRANRNDEAQHELNLAAAEISNTKKTDAIYQLILRIDKIRKVPSKI
ncbi:MAG: hypothetical protein PHI55_13630, partial [Burkholderiaceae bacterium]|nr:hypothetical protein [Burkholderiaceae bacterium]